MNHVLALEAATGTASMAVLRGDGTLLAAASFVARRTMAQRLVPMLATLLHSVDLDAADLDAIAVGLGPGSFTSLRVVLATAQGLALAGEVAMLGVGSLEVLAAGAPLAARRPVCAVIAAPKRHVYAAAYARVTDDQFNCLFGPELLAVDDLAARLASIGQELAVVGPLAPGDREVLAAAGASFVPTVFDVPRAAVLGQLALARFARGERHDPLQMTPQYVLPSEPEVRLGRTFARPHGPGDGRSA